MGEIDERGHIDWWHDLKRVSALILALVLLGCDSLYTVDVGSIHLALEVGRTTGENPDVRVIYGVDRLQSPPGDSHWPKV